MGTEGRAGVWSRGMVDLLGKPVVFPFGPYTHEPPPCERALAPSLLYATNNTGVSTQIRPNAFMAATVTTICVDMNICDNTVITMILPFPPGQ